VTRLIRVELLKLATVRASYLLLAAATALTALFASLEASRAGTKNLAPLSTSAGFTAVITGGAWELLLATVLGVLISSGEFRHATASLTYLAQPRRGRVLTAKLAAGACAGAVFGLAGYLVTGAAALGFLAARGGQLPVGAGTLARYGIGYLVATALLAAAGVAVGALIRAQVAAVVVVLAWMMVAESVLGGLYPDVRPYLPYSAAATLTGTPLGGAAFGPAHGVTGGSPLPFAAAAALVAAVAVAFAAVAARTTVRRDIT
jgi:ABC-type transport system involved in multi-copper enzyme maturation permease subunit